jgi:hypothetical protein
MSLQHEFGRCAKRRWWLFLVCAALGVGIAAFAVRQPEERAELTSNFVVRPATDLSPRDVSSALDALQPTGSLMNTLLGVLGSDDFAAQAARAARVDPATASVNVSLRPGSVIVDATISTPDARSTRALAGSFATNASAYVREKFIAYSLDRFATNAGAAQPARSAAQAIGAGALVGLLAAAALVALSVWRAEARARRHDGDAAPVAELARDRTKTAGSSGAAG